MLLAYLKEKSGVARVLSDDVLSLEDLLMPYCETKERYDHVIILMNKLMKLDTERLKLSNCMFDNKLPYDSLVGLETKDLETLKELCDYLDLPKRLCKKLSKAIEKGSYCGKYTFDPRLMSSWAEIGDLRGLKWAYEQKYTLPKSCKSGTRFLDCLEYLHSLGCKLDEETYAKAALQGRIISLKYLDEHKCPHGEDACTNAAKYSHMKTLVYLRKQGCPWDETTTAAAAANGRLECLKYLNEQGCPWDEGTCESAAEKGHLACLEYAISLGCECGYAFHVARNSGQTKCVEYLIKNGYGLSDDDDDDDNDDDDDDDD